MENTEDHLTLTRGKTLAKEPKLQQSIQLALPTGRKEIKWKFHSMVLNVKQETSLKKIMSFALQTCDQTITGRNLGYNRALEIIQNEEYLSAADLDIIRRIDFASTLTVMSQINSFNPRNLAYKSKSTMGKILSRIVRQATSTALNSTEVSTL